jgi:signal transduction histidine kinase
MIDVSNQNLVDVGGLPAEEASPSPSKRAVFGRPARTVRGGRYLGLHARAWAGAALVFSALLIFITASAGQFTLGRMQANFEWVKHTQRVLIQVGQLQANIFAAVATQRSYMLTKHANRLQDLDQIASEMDAQLKDIDDLTKDSPHQHERLGLVRGLIEQWLTRLRQELDKAAVGSVEASEVDDLAREGRTSIDNALQQVINAEVSLLDAREIQAERGATLSTYLGTLTLLLGLVTAGLGVWLIQSQRVETRIRDLQNQFIETARDAVIGETAVTFAHEVTQPLTAAKNYLTAVRGMMNRDTPGGSRQATGLDHAIIQVERATEVLRHLRGFGARPGPGRTVEPIERLIEDAISLSGLDWNGTVLIRQITPNLPKCLVDRVHVQQVLVNLARNGLEAMAHSSRREMIIAAELAHPTQVRVSVRDTGPGLPTEVLNKIFRPFVTTKEGGMGVGLSICRRIVEAHGGQISARNLGSGGTVFEFTLPVEAAT